MTNSEPNRYGYRHEILDNKQGLSFDRHTPLQAEDFLNPQPGDVFYQGEMHDRTLERMRRSVRRLLRAKPAHTVLSEVKLILPRPSVHHPRADLVIVANVNAPRRPRAVFDLAAEGVTPSCVIEITSPLFAEYDLNQKRDLYAAAGIPEYIILDTGLRAENVQPKATPGQEAPAPSILAYRLHDGVYHALPPDEQRRVYSASLGALIVIQSGEYYLVDPQMGLPITPDEEDAESLSASQAEGAFRAQSIASQLKL
jgi:Uma2 family endonuclease